MKIFILGLRRSGTTISWQMFRQDPRLLGLNEPFNPALFEIPVEIPNRSRAEVIDIFRKDPQRFWRLFAPIAPCEELQEGLSDRQQAWFRFLLSQADGVVLDATRCHFKLAALNEIAPDAVCVHLYRGPASVATSHLIPTGSGGFRGSWHARARGRLGFFTRRGRYNNWSVEEIVSGSPESLFGQRLREIGLDPERIYALPALGRVLAWWRVMYERLEREGPRLYGERFLSLSFEAFCREPREAVARIYALLGAEAPELDVSRVHAPKGSYQPERPEWGRLCDEVGIAPELRDF